MKCFRIRENVVRKDSQFFEKVNIILDLCGGGSPAIGLGVKGTFVPY
jgi:hypothetical protein